MFPEAKPRFENKFGEVFEPFIEETPPVPAQPTAEPAKENVDKSGAEADTTKTSQPAVAETPAPTKPSPIKTHTPPVTLKKEFAGKSLKASLLDAFNDAVFNFPSRKPKPKSGDTQTKGS